jgi:hypothetical protein
VGPQIKSLRGSFASCGSSVCVAGSLGSSLSRGQLRLVRASMCDRRNRALQPRSKRCRDRRCSSGSSLGQAPSGVRMPAQRTMSTFGWASSRGDRYAARLRARAPWFVKPRRVSGGKLRSCRGNVARAGVEATMSPGKSHRRRGRGPNPARRFPPSSARAGRVTSAISTRIRKVRGCARGLF